MYMELFNNLIYFFVFLTFPITSSFFYIKNINSEKYKTVTFFKFLTTNIIFTILAGVLTFFLQLMFTPLFSPGNQNGYTTVVGIAGFVNLFFILPTTLFIFLIGSMQKFRENKKYAYILAAINLMYLPVVYLIFYSIATLPGA